ncbi:MAG TPA: isochorismate synthase, partial [Coleofasciculaceae cyanobacterium]
DCYVFSAGNGKGQSMIGASPERLLSVQNQRLITDALAGSAPRGQTAAEDQQLAQQLLNSDKEQREHRLVVDFITQQLAAVGLVPHYAAVPTLLQLSNIQHLHTPIHAAFSAEQHPLEILAKLHPTPAVAGMPRAIACQQIRQYEQFERSLYAAPLGWVDAQGNAEFIVGIRSALLKGNQARLYAGAGIVAGSDPARELAEVRLKLQALLQALV